MRLNLSPSTERYVLVEPNPATPDDVGIAITARPALTEVIEEAKSHDDFLAFADELRGLIDAEGDGEVGDVTPDMIRAKSRSGVIFAKVVARIVIEGWEGVEDPDGSPAPVTADRVDAFLDHPAIYDLFAEKYLARWLTVQLEKNGSAPSPSGTSAGAAPTVKRARKPAQSARAESTRPRR
ncbi:MAG: hypothetical protein GYB50_03930 [Rhodobacteraceae bacterium]|nr:hypothetical protein [Paracoccaceae bacterium]